MIELPAQWFGLNIRMGRVYELNKLADPCNRMIHLQEEQGELAQALSQQDQTDTILEAIDVLLMLLSIYADHVPQDDDLEQYSMEFHKTEQRNVFGDNRGKSMFPQIIEHYLTLCWNISCVANLTQQLQGVASSQYKVDSDLEPIDYYLIEAIQYTFRILAVACSDTDMLQEMYDAKMDKWEKVSQ